jgi:glycogen synthase
MSGVRVALMPSAYAPMVGGVEVLTARLAHNLAARGHQVEVWAPTASGGPQREVLDGVTVRRFDYPLPRADLATMARFPARALRALGALRAAVADFGPTHLHVQCFSGNGAYATALHRLTGVPLVVTLQGETVMDDGDIYDRSATLRAALRWGLRRARSVTGCSQFTLDDASRRFGLDPAKAQVVFNGVDLDEVAPGQVDLHFDRYVFAVGRVVRKKGFDLLIDAFALARDQLPEVGLVIGGDGAELPHLRAQVERLGLRDAVHFTGRLDRSQVAAAMAGAEVFVMPSRLEPFGIVVLEAWRAGVPVIATSHGGPPEFVGVHERGVVTAPEDTASMARALVDLLSDHGLRQKLSANSALALPEFTWQALASQYENVYA